jgi:hypothetical protein
MRPVAPLKKEEEEEEEGKEEEEEEKKDKRKIFKVSLSAPVKITVFGM